MKNIILAYPPFCTPASPPYSITYLKAFLDNNTNHNTEVLDLNAAFHSIRFPEFRKFYQEFSRNYDLTEYEKTTQKFMEESSRVYSENNRRVVDGKDPELIDKIESLILKRNPEIVAFSIVYSSQCFYALALIKRLKKKGIKTIVGGPAVTEILANESLFLKNEIELVEHFDSKAEKYDTVPDFSIFDKKDYFIPEVVVPIRASNCCYYRQCAFCTHFSDVPYMEFPLEDIEKSIRNSKMVFITDDMMHKKRLLEIGEITRKHDVRWMCQLRPTNDLDRETLSYLYKCGLRVIIWGVESGSDKVLKKIRKGTNTKDIVKVLKDSHDAGIRNVCYIMFGFPTETKDDFIKTINLLKDNEDNIDLISTSIFGLQKGSYVYKNPIEFGITKIETKERTVLEPKITYEVYEGMTQAQAAAMRKRYKKTIESINKYPKRMNFFREHMLFMNSR